MPSAIINQPGASYAATSSTSQAIGTGMQTFTVQSGLAYQQGSWVSILSTGSGATEYGQVTSYSGASLVVSVQSVTGSGSHTDWTINLASPPPPPGAWVTASLTNSWAVVSSYNTPRYRLEADGVTVRLSGAIQSGTSATSAFTLPSGLRPANSVVLAAVDFSHNAGAYLTVATSGTVTVTYSTASPQIALEDLTFPIN